MVTLLGCSLYIYFNYISWLESIYFSAIRVYMILAFVSDPTIVVASN